MIQIWKGPRNRIAISDGCGMGSPTWDHWAILLHEEGEPLRVALADSKSNKSIDEKWKLYKTMELFDMKEVLKTCPTCKHDIYK